MRYLKDVSILIGSTGYVGTYLLESMIFDKFVHRSDVASVKDSTTDMLICAGMPATKWLANMKPAEDFHNMNSLWDIVKTIHADIPILISTIDVYDAPFRVDENVPVSTDGAESYGSHRAILEGRFSERFPHGHIIRLPGLFSKGLRKNLIFDLINSRSDQYMKVNSKSQYQFFNLVNLPNIIEFVLSEKIQILNVSSEPIQAQEIANIFGVELLPFGQVATYDMQTIHGEKFGIKGRYLFSKESVLSDIESLSGIR